MGFFKETNAIHTSKNGEKKGHVTLVMYESILMRVSMDSFPPSVFFVQIIPWDEINIKSMHHLVSIVLVKL